MKYILTKNTIIRKEKFDKIRYYIYSPDSHKILEINSLTVKILKICKESSSISDMLKKIPTDVITKQKITELLDKMISYKYLEKYE